MSYVYDSNVPLLYDGFPDHVVSLQPPTLRLCGTLYVNPGLPAPHQPSTLRLCGTMYVNPNDMRVHPDHRETVEIYIYFISVCDL